MTFFINNNLEICIYFYVKNIYLHVNDQHIQQYTSEEDAFLWDYMNKKRKKNY